jgi:Ca2+-transporting ATPase
VGLLAFDDHIRDNAPAAVALCQGAGIRVIVVSGNHVSTVAAAAEKVRGSSTYRFIIENEGYSPPDQQA